LFYQSPERALLDVPRATGSVAKVVAAVSLAKAGSVTDTYCNLRIDGVLRNADGDTGRSSCAAPGGRVSARESFRKSLNLPVFYALQNTSDGRLRDLATRAGFKPYPDIAARTAISFGMVSASPGDMVRLMTVLGKATRGQDARAPSPRILAAVSWRDNRGRSPLPARMLDLSPYLDGHATQFAGTMLSEPLQKGGTAHALSTCTDRMGWRLAKTGTVALDGRVASKLLVTAGRYREQPVTMVGVVGTIADTGDVTPITTAALANIMCKSTAPPETDVQS
jgi:membrane peptidoglycan carboxypeptidase